MRMLRTEKQNGIMPFNFVFLLFKFFKLQTNRQNEERKKNSHFVVEGTSFFSSYTKINLIINIVW